MNKKLYVCIKLSKVMGVDNLIFNLGRKGLRVADTEKPVMFVL